MAKKKPPMKEIELEPDAWRRFERFIVKAAKTPPKHKTAKRRKKRSAK